MIGLLLCLGFPILLWFAFAWITDLIYWIAPPIPGYHYFRWNHVLLVGSSFYCLLLYVPILVSLVLRKTRGLNWVIGISLALWVLTLLWAGHLKANYVEKLTAEYDRAIQANPQDASAYVSRGRAFVEVAYFDQAIADFSKALEIVGDKPEGYYDRGAAYLRKGDFVNAAADLNKAIQLAPEAGQSYGARAMLYYYEKDYARSREDAQKAKSLGYEMPPGFLQALEKAEG